MSHCSQMTTHCWRWRSRRRRRRRKRRRRRMLAFFSPPTPHFPRMAISPSQEKKTLAKMHVTYYYASLSPCVKTVRFRESRCCFQNISGSLDAVCDTLSLYFHVTRVRVRVREGGREREREMEIAGSITVLHEMEKETSTERASRTARTG